MTLKYAVRDPIPQTVHDNLAQYHPLLRELLFRRNITSVTEAETFLKPDYEEHTHDPFLLLDMERAVDRILKAISGNERIAIYSDYDCDGIPGGVVGHDFFKAIGYTNFLNYIPHRNKEGFGLNVEAIESLAQEEVSLIITIDCGSTDATPIARANELGVDVIVTDHHSLPEKLPEAYAIINPKREGDEYPYKELCGTGVFFKLLLAILERNRFGLHTGAEKWWLDMVGLATLADMVPLTGENRVLARYGLTVLRLSRRKGLRQLCAILRIDQRNLSEDDISFMIAPRINAASRMDAPMKAFELLVAESDETAKESARHLDKINNERKGHVAAMVKEVKKRFHGTDDIPAVIVAGNPEWKPSLLGLVASSIAEEYRRPVFLWGKEAGTTLKGSCRSGNSVSVVSIMSSVPEGTFIDFGGHEETGGFVVDHPHIHTLEETLIAACSAADEEDHAAEIDKEVHIEEVAWDTYRALEGLRPFGVGNPKPLFKFTGGTVKEVGHMGKTKNHLRLTIDRGNGAPVEALRFFKTADDFDIELKEGKTLDVIGSLEAGGFRGRNSLRIRIESLAESSDILPA